MENRPEYGKQYALTGRTGDKCIMNGNTWAESKVETCDRCGRAQTARSYCNKWKENECIRMQSII